DLGSSASVPVSASTQPLFIPPGSSATLLPRETLQTIRIPLSSFAGVRVDRVKAIDLDFDRTSNGAVTVADLMVTDTTASLVKSLPFVPLSPVVFWVPIWQPDPVTYVLEVPFVLPGVPVEHIDTTGPFSARMAGPTAAEVTFTPPAGGGT